MKAILLLALVLTGCAGIGSSMSPEQMAQNVKDKNAVVACGSGSGPWGRVVTVYVDSNRIADNQNVSVDSECKVSVTGTKSTPGAKP